MVAAALRREQLEALLRGRRGPAGCRPPAAPAAGALHLPAARTAPPFPPPPRARPGVPAAAAGRGEPAAVVQQPRTAATRDEENAQTHNSPIPRTARLPRALSALFLATERGCCAPGRAATLPPTTTTTRGDPGRAAWEGGRAWKQRESVREQRLAGDGG